MAADHFPDALKFVLAREGGYVNHPADPGGATNKGVTQTVYDAHRDLNGKPRRSVKLIEDAEAYNIYRREYWNKIPGIESMSFASALVCFDIAVNSGIGRIKAWLKEIPDADPAKLIAQRRAFYASIIANKPSQKVFQKGWENRVKALEKAVGLA